MFENLEFSKIITDYIVGIPSGEVIYITFDDFINLKKKELINNHNNEKYFNFIDKDYQKIKNFLSYETEQIQKIQYFLDKYKISKYRINPDLSVDVKGSVNLNNLNLNKIPIKFRLVSGNFDCSFNKLTNLVNSPYEVEGEFDCSHNNIYTLIGGPKYVISYNCSNNILEDLDGFPNICPGYFNCSRNFIKSLKGLPKELIVDYFDISYNRLKNLQGGCETTRNFNCSNNQINTLENGIKTVNGIFNCSYNKLLNFEHMPSSLKIIK